MEELITLSEIENNSLLAPYIVEISDRHIKFYFKTYDFDNLDLDLEKIKTIKGFENCTIERNYDFVVDIYDSFIHTHGWWITIGFNPNPPAFYQVSQ